MKRVTLITIACFTAVFAARTLTVAAQDFNPQEKTYLTFSNAVEMPGMMLQAGTYTFRLADSPARNVVQVLSQDEQKVYGQFLFVQKERPDVSSETVIAFKETPAGTTPAIQYWFYPNEKIGKEFIYPKDQALKIAKATGQAVLTEEGPVTTAAQTSAAETTTAAVEPAAPAAPPPAPAPAARQPENLPGTTAETQTQAQAQVETRSPAQPASADNRPVGTSGAQASAPPATDRAELPRTASPLEFSGLLGLLSLVSGLGVRFARR